ncbi:MAG: APC family permease [Pseudomonadota bacterium]
MIKVRETHPSTQLLRRIGGLGIALIVLNSMIGAGIFALPAKVAVTAGNFSPWLFIIVGLLFMSVVLTFAELGSYFEDTGGPALYASTAFGNTIGFGTGWILYISRATAFAANVSLMAEFLGALVPYFAAGLGRVGFITSVSILLTWANYRGVRNGIQTLLVLSALKLSPLLLLVLMGLGAVNADLIPEQFPSLSEFGAVSLLVIYAFVGFESATIVSGEIDQPQKTIPWALVSTVAVVAVFYFLLVTVYIAVIPAEDIGSGSLTDAGVVLFGTLGGVVISCAAIFSIGGNLAAILLAASRITFSMGEQKMLPRWFGVVHPRHATPANSILALGALSLCFALSGSFVVLAVASSLTRLLTYIVCIASLPSIRRRADALVRAQALHLPGGYLIPAVALLICLWMVSYSPFDAWLISAATLLCGLVLYGVARRTEAGE